jgi:nucleoside-diphosphate-sugar epimerase
MRIFLTGGTGYIGSAVLDALVRGGHRVDALVRNSERAAEVQGRGARAILGNLSQPASYADAASAADGAVHTAFEHSARGIEVDGIGLDTLLRLPEKPGRFMIYTSAVWVLGTSATPMDESAALNPAPHVTWRPGREQQVLDSASAGIRPAVIRPGIVYGGSRGIVADLFRDAANGLVRVIGAGENHWPLVYDRDLGDLYLRLVNQSGASGLFHANDERDEQVNDLVAAIARHVPLRPSIRRVPIEEARRQLGSYADALMLDQVVRSPRARALGWNPSLHSVSGNAARLLEEWRRGREAA